MNLREFLNVADHGACKIFNSTGIIYPMCHAVTAAGEHKILVMDSAMEKDEWALLMRAYFTLNNVVRFVFIDEAYTVATPDRAAAEEIIRTHNEAGLKDHPDRVEVLMYSAEDRLGLMIAWRPIIRPAHGKARLGPLEFDTPKMSEGRFFGMLPPQGEGHA